ncbi:MAG: cupin domain-containing protein [Candidatus Omnitrophica bacterium]|nr:cupin domain-containing protein [Candidatus Omnitrophota bacterium]
MLIKKLAECEEFIAGDGCILREYLHPGKENLALRYSLAHATVSSGQTTQAHILKTCEVYYILEGRGIMHVNEASRDVSPGDIIYIPPQATQYIENPTDTALKFLCIVDPAWRSEDEKIL